MNKLVGKEIITKNGSKNETSVANRLKMKKNKISRYRKRKLIEIGEANQRR